jgi:superfamily I DNA and/or RNA helicase
MLFNKYQYNEDAIKKRGYSQHCQAVNEEEKTFWVKWILGIEKNDAKHKMLSDKLRHLQIAKHQCLPEIVKYDFDDEQKAYAVVYEYLQGAESLENKAVSLSIEAIISGLVDLAECLNSLHAKHKINHGDMHPGNILVDENNQFFLIDFQLAEITRTFSQEKKLEIFAREFAAPEKFDWLSSADGFPYQADIYSFGKIIDWIFHTRQEGIPEEQSKQLQRLLVEKPADRPKWQEVIDFLKKYPVFSETRNIQIACGRDVGYEIISLLNNANPVFDISPTKPAKQNISYFVSLVSNDTILNCSWIEHERKLVVHKIDPSPSDNIIEIKMREGKKLPFKVRFVENIAGFDLTAYFQKWFNQKQTRDSLKRQGKAIRDELQFYRELLEKELNVINQNSLHLQYSKFEIKEDNTIVFHIKEREKNNSRDFILKHIDDGNAINSEGVEYIVSANADRKQNKEVVTFAGTPYEYEKYEDKEGNSVDLFMIKDYEHLKKDDIPNAGYIRENTIQKEEEKKRQLDAITKAERNEVQNPQLIYFLFQPSKLPVASSSYDPLEHTHQKDKQGNAFCYSLNQNKAIRNALDKTPFSIIQGPPGTGKTTVITEIVFQLLAKKPESKILITSQTNNAVDQVLENLLKNDIPILRLSGMTLPKIKEIQEHTLNKKLDNWKVQIKKNAENNFKKLTECFYSKMKPLTKYIVEKSIKEPDWIKRKNSIERIADDFCSEKQSLAKNMIIKESDQQKRKDFIERVAKNSDMERLRNLPDEESEATTLLNEVLEIDYSKLQCLSHLHHDWLATVSSLDENSDINKKFIDSIRVIGATCNHIAAKKYNKWNFEFDYVIMDEAGKATIAESLVPIVTGNNLILVGDHRQLRPMLTVNREVERWLRDKFKKESEELEDWDEYYNRPSLFEQAIIQIDSDYKSQLTECRRLPAEQVTLTSKYFYETEEDEAIEPVERDIAAEHNLPLSIDSPILFIDTGSAYKNRQDEGRSSFNEESAKVVVEILKRLNQYEIVKDYSLGVIACYKAQFHDLKKAIDKLKGQGQLNLVGKWQKLEEKLEEKLTVSVVDRF